MRNRRAPGLAPSPQTRTSSCTIANNLVHIPWRPSVGCSSSRGRTRRQEMLWTIFVILLVLWLLGVVSSYTLGGFIHILLVIALVVLLIQLISGRRPVV